MKPSPHDTLSPTRRLIALATLILAGEAIFVPPYHPGRYFRTTLLDAFGIDEFQLGEAQAWYGLAAMICYALGGPLADRFSPRLLMAGSILATGLGSLYMATLPSLFGLKCLFAYWGASTILAFWSPLARATRALGGEGGQGKAFGVVDGGRGFVALCVAVASTAVVGGFLADTPDGTRPSTDDTVSAMRWLMIGYTAFSVVAAVVVWCGVPRSLGAGKQKGPKLSAATLAGLLKRPAIWLQAAVVLTAYCAFKTFDYYGHYCEDLYGLSKAQSSMLTAWLTGLRIVAAFGAGWVADRFFGAAGTARLCFGLSAVAFGLLYAAPAGGWFALVVGNLAVAWSASCALRGVYFATLQESSVPASLTGSAAGLVSFVGFTPDIFWPLLAGWLVESAREAGDVAAGYQRLWLLLAGLAIAGLVAAAFLRRQTVTPVRNPL
ncbi:MAG: MFS transporter [Planctomycetota bacterium]